MAAVKTVKTVKMEEGMVVMTKWDDLVKPIKGLILDVYRGHRGMKAIVMLPDCTVETITADQIVKVCKQ